MKPAYKAAIFIIIAAILISLAYHSLSTTGTKSTGGDMRAAEGTAAPGGLRVHFIDVGQADAILIMGPDSQNILIDAGNNDDSRLVVDYIRKQGVKSFKAVIGTHPHEDHIGGLDAVINSFDIEQIYLPRISDTTATFKDVLKAIKNKGLKVNTAAKGVKLDFDGMTLEFFGPIGNSYKELNDYSAVVKLTYGDTGFLFEGDAEAMNEAEMLNSDIADRLRADVIKIGHHGSSGSTTPAYLDKVNPRYAVISVGRNNDYGHPHRETMQLLRQRGIPVYRTDENGTIIAVSDGKSITFNTKPGSYAYGGMGDSTQALPEEKGLIKGNINSKGEKIYHLPGGAYYDETVPEVWFKTEAEAQAAGFRKAQR